ncbi:helix-turn-helix transcriptional regulator [Rummeliibacillus sp. TYF-LIM-RU47]|uniref:helix-turn-helix transcriptional regulator n=1 Tax=Rummeliibacillus sp. TYF-LIM-RU47 TaxID=2608406 RepID=UPI00123B2F1B|nr:helix-turn-helix domain-containing protein [Rummeliibacillus sp. TYF-LIM-RU47]
MRTKLIELRKGSTLTQAELAEKLGISEIHVRKIESGDRNPSVTLMVKYEKLFNESMKDLFPDIFFIDIDTKRIKNKQAI